MHFRYPGIVETCIFGQQFKETVMTHRVHIVAACLLSLFLSLPAFGGDQPERPADAPVLAHVHLYCNQLEPMIDFFVQGFDGQLALRRKFGQSDGAVINLGSATLLYIQQIEVGDSQRNIAAYDHIAFNVPDVEKALQKALAAPGASLGREIAPSGTSLTAFVAGPEGLRVELVQPGGAK